MRCLIIGCGYVGSDFAEFAVRNDFEVYAVTRSPERASQFEARGLRPIVWDWLGTSPLPSLPYMDRLLISVSHASAVGLEAEETHTRGLQSLLGGGWDGFGRCVYLSTTGVYAPVKDGSWVDEDSSVGPQRPGSRAALAAEQWLEEHVPEERRCVLRLAGIYGPGRVPNVDALRSGKPIDVDRDSYLNLIHVRDIVRAIHLAFDRPTRNWLYALSDGHPVVRGEYYDQICRWLGIDTPPFSHEGVDVKANRRGSDNKRVSNRRFVEDFQFEFLFPSYREGLPEALGLPSKRL